MQNSTILGKPQKGIKPLNLIAAPIGEDKGILIADTYVREQTYTGNLYTFSYGDDVASGTTVYFLLNVDSGYDVHIAYKINSDKESTIAVYENPDVSTNGTEVSSFNKNRNYSDTYNSVFYVGPSVNTEGDLLFDDDIFGEANGRTITTSDGTFASGAEEWVFKAGNSYLLSYTNLSGNSAKLRVKATFFEEAV